MTTALRIHRRPDTRLVQKQDAWDRFFAQALAQFKDPNPNLRRDKALDRTIRALGQRPRAPLTVKEREDLALRAEVDALLAAASCSRGHVRSDCRKVSHVADTQWFESFCDDALENSEAPCR